MKRYEITSTSIRELDASGAPLVRVIRSKRTRRQPKTKKEK